MRKRYRVTTEARSYEVDLTEAEHEAIRAHYHGSVSIEPVIALDFEAIAQELHEGSE